MYLFLFIYFILFIFKYLFIYLFIQTYNKINELYENDQLNDALNIIEIQFNKNSNFDAKGYYLYAKILQRFQLCSKSKEMFNKAITLSNYKDKIILIDYLELIIFYFGDINEIKNILNYSLKLNNHNYKDYRLYDVCYML